MGSLQAQAEFSVTLGAYTVIMHIANITSMISIGRI